MKVTQLCGGILVCAAFLSAGTAAVAQRSLGPSPAPAAPTTPAAPVARPSTNTGTGFFVSQGKIYDANGVEFRIRGVNQTHWWAGTGEEAIPGLAAINANAVRTVFGPDAGANTPALRESIARKYIEQKIVPIVEYHNATCKEDPGLVSAAVDLWTGPDKDWLKQLERYTIINITNEWGPNSPVWRDAYKEAVVRLRHEGIKNLLVIDAGGACGQLADSIETWGKEIFDADPEKNVAFSIHMYGFWVDPGSPKAGKWDGHQPYDVDAELGKLAATGLPLIVGEFSWQGHSAVTYTTAAALTAYEKYGIGWLAWMWNNPGGDSTVDISSELTYKSPADLTEFGRLIVDDPRWGLKTKAQKATVF